MNWVEILIVGFLWYQVIAHVGISAGLHRYFAHRAFSAPVWFEWVVLFLCTFAGARSPIGWISAHRMHHAHSDTDEDPHSPTFKGFWTVMLSQWQIKTIPVYIAKDLFANPRLRLFHQYWAAVWIVGGIGALALGIDVFLAFIVIPAFLSLIGFGLVNAICHLHGESRNFPLANILTAGEGYHAEHHTGKFLRFHKYDQTGAVLEWMMNRGWIGPLKGGKWT